MIVVVNTVDHEVAIGATTIEAEVDAEVALRCITIMPMMDIPSSTTTMIVIMTDVEETTIEEAAAGG